MNILILGDIIGSVGCSFLKKTLPEYRKNNNIDLVIANGENSADGNGISQKSAQDIFDSSVDIITTGNHIFRQPDYKTLLANNPRVIRPANLIKPTPGDGYYIFNHQNIKICVINLLGKVFLHNNLNPFDCVDNLLSKIKADIIIVDFHAEATSEKIALGYYLDSKVTAVVGTHTHVQTADEQILPKNTAYITDLGMVGPIFSVLGVETNIIIERLKSNSPIKFKNATGKCKMCGVIIYIDNNTFKPYKIIRINYFD